MRWRNSAALSLLAAASGVALSATALWPAIAQRGPQSILPPGFGDSEPANGSAPARPDPAAPTARPPVELLPPTSVNPSALPSLVDDQVAEVDDMPDNAIEAAVDPHDLPPEARRSLDRVGLLDPADGGFADTAYGATNGRFLSTLMRTIDAPIASRWMSILLRRTLISPSLIPAGLDGADWVAERAWLLVRMGEADNSRALVERVDAVNYTPKLLAVAMQAALATGDPAALCPIADHGADSSTEPAWPLAQAMCAGLSGESGTATALADRVRDRRQARGIDVLLAEKVIGAAGNTRRAVTIQWDDVTHLTAWRYGMATATGTPIPERLFDTVGPQVRAWQARAPLATMEVRAASVEKAAVLGVMSSAALADFYGLLWDETDPAERNGSVGEGLRLASSGSDTNARLGGLRSLWSVAGADPYARAILTARASAMIPADEKGQSDADKLIVAMLSAGLDLQASRWAGRVSAGTPGWAALALGSPQPLANVSANAVRGFSGAEGGKDGLRAKFLLAGLAGLNRLPPADVERVAEEFGVPLGRQSSWTRALDRAVASGEAGTVVLIAAAGMQTRDWRYVPPDFLFHIVSALRRVGLEPEARMIAAEAVART